MQDVLYNISKLDVARTRWVRLLNVSTRDLTYFVNKYFITRHLCDLNKIELLSQGGGMLS